VPLHIGQSRLQPEPSRWLPIIRKMMIEPRWRPLFKNAVKLSPLFPLFTDGFNLITERPCLDLIRSEDRFASENASNQHLGGVTHKSEASADVRCGAHSGLRSDVAQGQKPPHFQTSRAAANDIVIRFTSSARRAAWADGEPSALCRCEVYQKLKFRRLLDGQVSRALHLQMASTTWLRDDTGP